MTTENSTAAATLGEVAAPAKKVAAKKKSAPKKKAAPAKKVVAKVAPEKEVLRASSIAEAIKTIKKAGQKLGVIIVGGKKYSFTLRTTWAISKNLIKNGEAGLIMIVKEEGHYVYPAKAYKELFSKIMKSSTWAEIGSYSQSTLPQWHAEYFTAVK
jgi:hypothetical protein